MLMADADGLPDGGRDALLSILADLTEPAPADPPAPTGRADPAALVAAITARPWRRSAVDAATLADITGKVAAAIAADRPLEFSLPFGGYKGWRLPGAPHIDWAELFWVGYLRQFAQRLARLHGPGIVLSLTCLRGLLGWVNNLPADDQESYLAELLTLLRHRSSPRITLRCVDLTPLCGGTDAALTLMAARERDAPDPTPAQRDSAARNLLRRGGVQDLSTLSDRDWQAAITRAARRCAIMEGLEPRRTFNKFGPRIQVTHVRGASLSLHLGSCRSAVAQPWVSTGFLEWRGHGWLERMGSQLPAGACRIAVRHPMQDLSPLLSTLPLILPGAGPEPAAP